MPDICLLSNLCLLEKILKKFFFVFIVEKRGGILVPKSK